MQTDHEEVQRVHRGIFETARSAAGGGEEGQGARRSQSKEFPQLAGTFPSPRTTQKSRTVVQ